MTGKVKAHRGNVILLEIRQHQLKNTSYLIK